MCAEHVNSKIIIYLFNDKILQELPIADIKKKKKLNTLKIRADDFRRSIYLYSFIV